MISYFATSYTKFSPEKSTINTRAIPKLHCNIYFQKDESTKEFQLSIKDCSRYGGNMCCAVLSRSATSDSLWAHRPEPARLLCPWGFSMQEYWSGWPISSPGDLPNPGIEPMSPSLKADSYQLNYQRSS